MAPHRSMEPTTDSSPVNDEDLHYGSSRETGANGIVLNSCTHVNQG